MNNSPRARRNRRNVACDECKRRKIRCSADPICSHCSRDGKTCVYSSPMHRLSALQRTIQQYQTLVASITKAWDVYLPDIPLEQALNHESSEGSEQRQMLSSPTSGEPTSSSLVSQARTNNSETINTSDVDTPEQDNAEDYEFDESQDIGDSIDGMGFLTSEASKAGYTGPQSGIAALRLLRSLPAGNDRENGTALLTTVTTSPGGSIIPRSTINADALINDYFKYFHPSYPLLHEGLFRARLLGAVAKPRDGSWSLLYNIVVAMGAFSGDSCDSNTDWHYYQLARESISLSIIEKGSLTYVQGLIIMANYLQKRNKPNAGFALIGIAWSMALAIGLHREFGVTSTTHYIMEQRRRTWWTLFNFVSGAQLTLGRPPASLVGINLREPTNLDDANLTVDMTEMPEPQEGATISTALIAQLKLARIANAVQTELLTNPIPSLPQLEKLRRQIATWRTDLPACFDDDNHPFPAWFELPKRNILWRALHLRIVLHRPYLFQAVSSKADLSQPPSPDSPVHECIHTADTCLVSICAFLNRPAAWRRGFAWYATYWLLAASFVHAVCFASTPPSPAREHWRTRLEQAVQALGTLGGVHGKAAQAQRVLQRLLDSNVSELPTGGTVAHREGSWAGGGAVDPGLFDFSMEYFGLGDVEAMGALGADGSAFAASGLDVEDDWGWPDAMGVGYQERSDRVVGSNPL